jgi:hypothetical protein
VSAPPPAVAEDALAGQALDAQVDLNEPEDPRLRAFEPIFELGGPAYRAMQRIGIIRGGGPCIMRRSVAFAAITWVPMLLFAIWEGHAVGPTPRTSFLLDFATYARIFVAVPLIFAAESVVGPRIRAAGLRFVQGGLVARKDIPAFLAAEDEARRRREAIAPEFIFLAVALVSAWSFRVEQFGGADVATWHSLWMSDGPRISLAGGWYRFVTIPLVQFFLLRWLWRLVIWTLFLRRVTALKLNLFATHTDMAAGLGFLGTAHVTLAIFPFALSCVLAAELAFRVKFEGLDLATLRTMAPLLAAYILFVETVTFGPLLLLVPLLARVRRDGLRAYGMLVQHHNLLFHHKWIQRPPAEQEEPLGNPDMSSLVDLGGSFTVVRQMNLLPVGRRQLVQVAVVACLPGVPLALLVLPVREVIGLLMGVIT